VHGLRNTLYSSKFAVSLSLEFCSFAKFFSHTKSCAPCAKAKTACKPFDIDRAWAKARVETIRRSQARKTKQQTDAEWKVEVLRKLEELSELRGLRKDVWRIAVALEKLAGIESQDSDEGQISWPEFEGEETEVQESTEKGKQREQSSDRAEEEREVEGQEEEDAMEGVEEGSGGLSPVAYSVGTGAR